MTPRDSYWMGLALELASRGRGFVEPNPMVGCVIIENDDLLSAGYHSCFGGPHAEVEAISRCDPNRVPNSTVYVTLEPCSHFGKTPPCVDLLLRHRPKRVVIAIRDPYKEVAGRGIQTLRENAIMVDVGILEDRARDLNAPYFKLLETAMPWLVAKWAMTLDGAIATQGRDSKWISNERSRYVVHEIRSGMDAIVVGIGTAIADDPLLTTRLQPGTSPARVALRVILDRNCRLPPQSKLVQSLEAGPVMVAASELADPARVSTLAIAGCEILHIPEQMLSCSLSFVLSELGKRRHTNVLLEGGGTLLGHAFDEKLVDYVHCFIASKIIGGHGAVRPIAGDGIALMSQAMQLDRVAVEKLGDDVHIQGRVLKSNLGQSIRN